MQSLSHATFSATVTALALCTTDPRLIVLGGFCGLMPDLDTPNSFLGRLLKPISRIVSKWGHRQITHSLMGTAIAWVLFLPLAVFGHQVYWAAAIGYLCGWLFDAASKTGVPLFYPSPGRLVFPFDPTYRLKTGSLTERLLQVVLILLLGGVLAMNQGGGAIASFSNWLGTATGAVETYEQIGSQREIWAVVTGTHRITQAHFKAVRMRVMGTLTESDLIVQDPQGNLYRCGSSADAQIRAHRIQVEPGRAIAVIVQPIEMRQPAPLAQLVNVLRDSDYITGELLTEEGQTLSVSSDPRYFSTITVERPGGEQARINLKSATRRSLEQLPNLFVQGSVMVRRIQ